MKNYKCFIIALAASILLSGCGFKLRSTDSLPPQLKQVYYETEKPYQKFELSFKRRLKSSGTVLLPEPKKTAPIIHVSSNFNYDDRSPASTTQARVYNLTYTAIIRVTDFYDKNLMPPQTVSVARSISLQPNEVFENTPQLDISKHEMLQELSTKTLNILASPKTAQAIKIFDCARGINPGLAQGVRNASPPLAIPPASCPRGKPRGINLKKF